MTVKLSTVAEVTDRLKHFRTAAAVIVELTLINMDVVTEIDTPVIA